jgi:hypothetical protein
MSIYRIKGASGAVINQSTPLGERTVIGTGPDCDVVVEWDGGEGGLAEILRDGDGLLLRALQTGAVQVNGEGVQEQPLGSGDEIRVGSCRWVVQAPGLKPQRVLHGHAVRKKSLRWPWLAAAVVATAGAAAAWAWHQGWLVF